MSKLKPRYWIIISVVLILAVVVVVIAIAGYLPFIGESVAKSKINRYANEDIASVSFDFMSSKYVATTNTGEQYVYDFSANTIYDAKYSDSENILMSQKYQAFKNDNLYSDVIYPNTISTWTEIDADDYSIKYQKIYVMTIYDSFDTSSNEYKRINEVIHSLLEYMQVDFNITSLQITYATPNGLYNIECDNSKKLLSDSSIIKHITAVSENRYPLDYIEWKDSLS